MNDHDEFEEKLRTQELGALPPSWRRDILSSATAANAGRRPAAWLRELLWPHPAAWGALAALWLFLIGVDRMEPRPQVINQARTEVGPGQQMALAEQRRLWLELMGPTSSAVSVRGKSDNPDEEGEGPRSGGQGRVGVTLG